MKKSEAEKILGSWGNERVGLSRVRGGKVIEGIHAPTSPRRKGGVRDNPTRLTGWRHYTYVIQNNE